MTQEGELSNVSNDLGHGNNEDGNSDDEEHCEILGRVSVNSNGKQFQNKNHLSHSTGSKMMVQMKEKSNKRRYNKLTKVTESKELANGCNKLEQVTVFWCL